MFWQIVQLGIAPTPSPSSAHSVFGTNPAAELEGSENLQKLGGKFWKIFIKHFTRYRSNCRAFASKHLAHFQIVAAATVPSYSGLPSDTVDWRGNRPKSGKFEHFWTEPPNNIQLWKVLRYNRTTIRYAFIYKIQPRKIMVWQMTNYIRPVFEHFL